MVRSDERDVCTGASSVGLEVSLMDARDPLNSVLQKLGAGGFTIQGERGNFL